MTRRRNNNKTLVAVIVVCWFLFSTDVGVSLTSTAVKTIKVSLGIDKSKSEYDHVGEEKRQMLNRIINYCVPKLVCELFSSSEGMKNLSETEANLVSLIGSTTPSVDGSSKYHFAAHMGQLIRGYQGSGCHNFFPECPLSGPEVKQIAQQLH